VTSAIIATTPAAMAEANRHVLKWIEEKLASAKHELVLANQTFNALQNANLRTQPAQTQIRHANRRVAFYEKVRAAVRAGYYIIPPFDCQVFALRVKEGDPRTERDRSNWANEGRRLKALPVGEGRYVNPAVVRRGVDSVTEEDSEGKSKEVTIYENVAWEGVEFPLKALKPELIETTFEAMQLKIFDALGIHPLYRAPDPIIVGQIRHYKSFHKPITFFVAWWLDERDL
jgi:hypothetical protein